MPVSDHQATFIDETPRLPHRHDQRSRALHERSVCPVKDGTRSLDDLKKHRAFVVGQVIRRDGGS